MNKKYYKLPAIFFIAWIIMAQSCFFLRTSDKKAIAAFGKDGVVLHTATLLVNKQKFHYVYTGIDTLPTIVFVHGSPGSSDAFEKYLKDPDLLKQYRMVSVDRPGFGYSNFGHALNLEEQSIIISALFPQIDNGKPVFLVGHSLGGPMVVRLAVDNPGLFRAIVILAGSIDASLENKEYWRKIFIGNILQYLIPGALRPSNNELWYLKSDLKLLAPHFKEITCAVYIVHGTKDPLVPYGNMAYGAKVFVNAAKIDTTSIEGANHFIPWEKYDTIKNVLLRLRD